MEMICPYCGTRNRNHRVTTGDEFMLPSPGDFAMCWNCKNISVVTDASAALGVQTRKLGEREHQVVIRRPEVMAMLDASKRALGPMGAVRLASLDHRTYDLADDDDDPMGKPPKDYGADRYDYIEIDAPEDVPVPMWLTPEWQPCQDCRANAFLTWTGNEWTTTVAHDEGCPTLLYWEAQQ